MSSTAQFAAQQKTATPQQRALCEFLRSKAGPKQRKGVLDGGRMTYFKGSAAIKALRSDAYTKLADAGKVPKLATPDEAGAIAALHTVLPTTLFLRVERGGVLGPAQTGGAAPPPTSGPIKAIDQIRVLQFSREQKVEPEGYYVYLTEGSQLMAYLGGVGLVLAVLLAVMFPLWPPILRQGVWYLSMAVLGLIGLFFAVAVFRLIFYVVTIFVLKPGIWIFPNLFEDVGFVSREMTPLELKVRQVDSFIPTWAWVEPPKKRRRRPKVANGDSAAPSEKTLKVPSTETTGAPSGISSRAPSPSKDL